MVIQVSSDRSATRLLADAAATNTIGDSGGYAPRKKRRMFRYYRIQSVLITWFRPAELAPPIETDSRSALTFQARPIQQESFSLAPTELYSNNGIGRVTITSKLSGRELARGACSYMRVVKWQAYQH